MPYRTQSSSTIDPARPASFRYRPGMSALSDTAAKSGTPYAIPALPSRYGHFKAFYFCNAGNIRVHGGDVGLDWTHPDWGRFRVSHAITRIAPAGLAPM